MTSRKRTSKKIDYSRFLPKHPEVLVGRTPLRVGDHISFPWGEDSHQRGPVLRVERIDEDGVYTASANGTVNLYPAKNVSQLAILRDKWAAGSLRSNRRTSRCRGSARRNSRRRRTSLRRNENAVDARERRERTNVLDQIEVCYSTESQAGGHRLLQRAIDLRISNEDIERAKRRGLADRAYQLRRNSSRRGSRRLRRNSGPRPLYGHTSMATAYLVDDYPYGYNLRTQIRYWLEHSPKKGYRFVSQTMDPKRHVWNKPKASTYLPLAAVMYLDGNGHVKWTGLGMHSKASDVADFIRDYPDAVNADIKGLIDAHVRSHTKYAAIHEKGLSGWLMNGVPTTLTEGEVKRNLEDLDAWTAVQKLI